MLMKLPVPRFHVKLAYGPQREKTCLQRFANNTGVDQPAHPGSLISAFVIRFFFEFDLFLYVPSTIFQLNRNGSSTKLG